jgi:glycerol-3-phosphate acyltransferase PlsY
MGPISGAVVAYLLGCVPAARLASRLTNGNAAEPWVMRLADFAKGFAATALLAPIGSIGQAVTVTAVLAGDQWPLRGEAGRSGQWAFLGAMTALTPMALPIWGALWAIGFVATGYLAMGRVAAAALLPLLLGFIAGWPIGGIALAGCVMILERNREVIRRVRAGEEPKHHWNSAA